MPQQKKEKKSLNQSVSNQIRILKKNMADSDLETQEKSEEAQSPSLLSVGILSGICIIHVHSRVACINNFCSNKGSKTLMIEICTVFFIG